MRSSLLLACLVLPVAAYAQEKITFQDHILPLVEANCAKCHNADKKKGDLDLTSYGATLAGGASGKVIVPGDADASKLVKVITHAEEPTMPPNRGKMPDKEVAVFKKWIAGGLLETLNSKAVAGRPTVDMSLGAGAIGKPEGPPPMPGDLLMEPVVSLKRATAVTGLAASPWAPLIAVAGQKQVALYHSDTLELLGILPFKDEASYQPEELKFSRNGKLLIVGGGHAAKSGRVMVFDITSGERIITVGAGQEFDSVLAADLSPDQGKIALGGPSRMLKIYSTKDGSVLFKIKKHTDWITAAAFSPNGEWLASADRNGGVVIWDADNGLEIHTVAGHKSAVHSLSWRSDSKVLASVSEDSSAKIWEMQEGKQVKTWNPHAGGALSLSYTHDGRIITSGRDNAVTAWSADGTKLKSYEFTNELPVRAIFTHDGARVVAADWTGRVTVWDGKSGKTVGQIAANPPTLSEQVATTQARLSELQSGTAKPSAAALAAQVELAKLQKDAEAAAAELAKAKAALAPKEAEYTALKAQAVKNPTPQLEAKLKTLREARGAARLAVTNAATAAESRSAQLASLQKSGAGAKAIDPAEEIAALKARLSKLQAAKAYAALHHARESLATRKREQEKLLASGTKADKSAAEKLGKQIAKDEKDVQKFAGDYEKLKSAAAVQPAQQSRL